MRFSLAFAALVVAAAAAPARADKPKAAAPTVADVQAALDAGKISLGHRLGEQVIALHPDDPTAAYLIASTCMSMGLFDEGNLHLDAALKTHPRDANLHGARAEIAELRGDDGTARAEAAAALAIDPAQPDAVDVQGQIDLLDRYKHDTSPEPEAGSPSELVATVLRKIAAGAPADEIAPLFDPGILANAPGSLPRGPDALVAIIGGAFEAARAQMSAGNYSFVAYEVGTDAPGDVVPVQLLIENRWTQERVDMIKKLFADPQGSTMLDPETKAIFDGLEPDDRDAVFARLVGSRRLATATLEIPVVRTGGDMRVADFKLNGTSLRDQLLPMLPHLMDSVGIDPTPTGALPPIPVGYDGSSGSHFPTSALIGMIAGLVALVSMLVRRR